MSEPVGRLTATRLRDLLAGFVGRRVLVLERIDRAIVPGGATTRRSAGAWELLDRMNARHVLVTRGSEGMTLARRDGACRHLPVSQLREVRDATGAGDTVAATVTLALVAGAAPLEAAHLGNIAAGIVVRRLGAATTNREELAAEIAAASREVAT